MCVLHENVQEQKQFGPAQIQRPQGACLGWSLEWNHFEINHSSYSDQNYFYQDLKFETAYSCFEPRILCYEP